MSNLAVTQRPARSGAANPYPCRTCARLCHRKQGHIDQGPADHRCICDQCEADFAEVVADLNRENPPVTAAWLRVCWDIMFWTRAGA
jgi:hypothetical protein